MDGSKGTRRGRWWKWALLVLAVVVGAHAAWTWTWQRRFEARVESLRAAGEPVEDADLETPAISPEENAAIAFAEADRWYVEHLAKDESLLKVWPAAREDLPPLEEEDAAADRAELRAWLARGDPYVAMLHDALRRPRWREELDWKAGPAMEVESIPRMQHAAEFLDQRVRQAERWSDRVLSELELLARLARDAELPCAIGLSVKWTVESVLCDAVEAASKLPGFEPGRAWERLHAHLRLAESAKRLHRALQAERVMGIGTVRRWADGQDLRSLLHDFRIDESVAPEPRWQFNWHVRALIYRDGVRLLDNYETYLELQAERPRVAAARAAAMNEEPRVEEFRLLAALFAGPPSVLFGERVKRIARARVTLVGLALLVERERTGAWPESLDDVIPLVGEENIVDPRTGERLAWEPGVLLESPTEIEGAELFGLDIAWRFDS